ncbi:MAG: formyltransferase family protein [Rhizomicrobium sp.]
MRKRVAILISGRGSNMRALIEASRETGFPAEIVLVFSNVESAEGLAFARAAGVPTTAFSHKGFETRAAFDAALDAVLTQAGGRTDLRTRLHADSLRRLRAQMGRGGCSTSIPRCCRRSRASRCTSRRWRRA